MKFSVIEEGTGQPLVFLHGIGANAATWQYQLATFSATYRVIALDLPGYGGSDPLPRMTFPALALWLHQLLVAYQLHNPILVGSSFGGMIVQEYLATYTSKIAAVILHGTSPAFGRRDGQWQQQFVRARLQPLDEGRTMQELAPTIVRGLVGSDADPAGIALAQKGVAAVTETTFRAAVNCLVDFDQRANLGNISIPCLVLAGAEDNNAPSSMMEKMATHIPTAQFVSLPRLGHMAYLEDPQRFNAALQAFLQTL